MLNARGRFAAAAAAPSLYNIAIIGGALLLGPTLGVEGLAIGVVVGSLLHLGVQVLPMVRERFRLSFDIDLSDPAARQVLALMVPRALGLGANQVTFIVATTLATGVGPGRRDAPTTWPGRFSRFRSASSAFRSASSCCRRCHAPSRRARCASSGQLIVRSMRLLLWVMLFLTAIGIVLRRQGVTLLFGYGLDERAISLTADTALVPVTGSRRSLAGDCPDPRLLQRPRHAHAGVHGAARHGRIHGRRGRHRGSLGLSGIALGLSAGGWAEAGALAVLLWRRMPGVGVESIVRPLVVFVVGAILAGLATLFVVRFTDPLIGPSTGQGGAPLPAARRGRCGCPGVRPTIRSSCISPSWGSRWACSARCCTAVRPPVGDTGQVNEARRLGDLVRELELRGMLRTVLAAAGHVVATLTVAAWPSTRAR